MGLFTHSLVNSTSTLARLSGTPSRRSPARTKARPPADQHSLETLEPRALMSPVVASVQFSQNPATAGAALVINVEASSAAGLRAVSIFRDVNTNGVWDRNIDEPLGDIFQQASPGRFQRTITPGESWARNSRIVAAAVDVNGAWGSPFGVSLTVNQRPSATGAVLSASQARLGQPVTLTASASDDTGVRAMTAFIDVDLNSRWTPGVDRWLADDFSADPLTGNFEFTLMPASNWPAQASIRVDAVDVNGAWAAASRSAGTIRITAPPSVQNLTVVAANATGQGANPMRFSVAASDETGIAAVTFYLDLDNNGRWSPNVDQSLGESRVPQTGTNVYSIIVATDLAGLASARVLADAVDTDGNWTGAPTGTNASLPRVPTVNQFLADTARGQISLGADAWFAAEGSAAAAPVSFVRFVADANFNGVEDSGDVVIADIAAGAAQQQGWRHYYRLTSGDVASLPGSYQWIAIPRFSDNGDMVSGPARVGVARAFTPAEPIVLRVDARVGVDAGTGSAVTPLAGTQFRVSADVFSASAVHGVTFFWDRNLNGRWDAGNDIDLGYSLATMNGMSGRAELVGTIRADMAGPGAIVAAARVFDANSASVWSVARSQKIDRVFAGPRLTLASSSVTGSILTIDVDARDDFGVNRIFGYLDLNGNGIDSQDTQVAASLVSGDRRNGRWRITIDLSSVPSNLSTVRIQGVDFYRGTGTTDGPPTGLRSDVVTWTT